MRREGAEGEGGGGRATSEQMKKDMCLQAWSSQALATQPSSQSAMS